MRRLGQKHGPLRSVDGETKLSRELSLRPDESWAHVSNLADLGDWQQMHQGWRSDLPDELAVGTTLEGVAGAKGMRNRVTWTVRQLDPPKRLEITGDGIGGTKYALAMKVMPTEAGCALTLKVDLGGRPLFGPVGAAAAARAVKGDIERFETLYA